MSNLKQFIEETKKNKGATYNLNTGEINPTSGFFVGLKGGKEVDPEKNSSEEIQKFVLRNSTKLSDKDNFLGSWIEKGILFLDVVVRIDKKEDAIARGKKEDQQAIYDASTKEVINL